MTRWLVSHDSDPGCVAPVEAEDWESAREIGAAMLGRDPLDSALVVVEDRAPAERPSLAA